MKNDKEYTQHLDLSGMKNSKVKLEMADKVDFYFTLQYQGHFVSVPLIHYWENLQTDKLDE